MGRWICEHAAREQHPREKSDGPCARHSRIIPRAPHGRPLRTTLPYRSRVAVATVQMRVLGEGDWTGGGRGNSRRPQLVVVLIVVEVHAVCHHALTLWRA